MAGNFYPYGWYGMKNRGNTLPRWLQRAGYRTALVGKWLNGYGARDAHGEVPAGFDIWRGLLDVSAYDYFNYVMNVNGQPADLGRRRVRAQARRVRQDRGHRRTRRGWRTSFDELTGSWAPAVHLLGRGAPEDYSPDVTGRITRGARPPRRPRSRKPFFIWWAPIAPHREDVATTLMGRPGRTRGPPLATTRR